MSCHQSFCCGFLFLFLVISLIEFMIYERADLSLYFFFVSLGLFLFRFICVFMRFRAWRLGFGLGVFLRLLSVCLTD